MLPICYCAKCEELTRDDCGVGVADAECPTLCDTCFERTEKAWKEHKEKGISIEEMITRMRQERPN